jgi:sec-independent protein translocase protein TatA
MGGMSLFHWLIILVIVILVMGPSRLPSLGKSLGEAIRGFKKGLDSDEIDVTRRENLNAGQQPPNSAQQSQQTPPADKPKSDS